MTVRSAFALGCILCGTATAAAADGPGVVVLDFERDTDIASVESRKPVEPSADRASHGTRSLKLRNGDYLNVRSRRLALGRRVDRLRFDLFNASAFAQQVRVEIFDDTSRKSYWHRHVREYALRPGWNTLSFGVGHLYRGEKNSRRIEDSYLDPARIERVDLAFDENTDTDAIYLDYVRFEPDPPMPPVDGLLAFDFGPENQAARTGFIASSRETFDAARGYGWSSSGWPGAVRDYTHPNDLLGDFREARGETFSVRVPDGAHHVRVYFEDNGWWEDQFARFNWRTITANGRLAHEERLSPEQAARRFYQFADTEPRPDTDVFDTYIANGRYKPKEFDAEVKGGRLDVRFDADRPMVCRVAALILWPTAQADAAAKWCAELNRRLKDEFNAENVYFDTSPRGRRMADLPGGALDGGAAVFRAGLTTPTGPGYIPLASELVASLNFVCVPGEDTGTAFSLRTTQAAGPVRVRARVADLNAAVFLVQNRLRRHGGGYTIVPDILRPLAEPALRADETRQFWLEITVPPTAKSGTRTGALEIEFANRTRSIPLAVDVLPISLSEPKMAFGLFGLMPDDPAPPGALSTVIGILRAHGMSSVSGVPLGRARAEAGTVKVDSTQADQVMAALRNAGFSLPVDTYGGTALEGVAEAAGALKLTDADALKLAMAALDEHRRTANWLPFSYSMVDEPQWSDDAVRSATKAILDTQAAAPRLLINGYWTASAANGAHRALMDALGRSTLGMPNPAAVEYLKTRGKQVGFYGGASRREFGLRQFSAWAEGFSAHYAWHFYVRYGDLYYDLDGREPDVCMVYYTPTEVRPALTLKDVRAGVFDFLYLRTCWDTATPLKDYPAALRAVALLDNARKAGNIYGAKGAPTIADLDAFRRQIADAIVQIIRQLRE